MFISKKRWRELTDRVKNLEGLCDPSSVWSKQTIHSNKVMTEYEWDHISYTLPLTRIIKDMLSHLGLEYGHVREEYKLVEKKK